MPRQFFKGVLMDSKALPSLPAKVVPLSERHLHKAASLTWAVHGSVESHSFVAFSNKSAQKWSKSFGSAVQHCTGWDYEGEG